MLCGLRGELGCRWRVGYRLGSRGSEMQACRDGKSNLAGPEIHLTIESASRLLVA